MVYIGDALNPLNPLRLVPSQVKMGKKLGAGGFGDIFLATLKIRQAWYKSSKTPVVVKRLRAEGSDERRLRIVVVSCSLPAGIGHAR